MTRLPIQNPDLRTCINNYGLISKSERSKKMVCRPVSEANLFRVCRILVIVRGRSSTNYRPPTYTEHLKLDLLQFSWRRGFKDSRDQAFKGLFSKDFISAFNILSISAISSFSVPNSPFSIKSKSPANNICVSNSQTEP